MGAEMDAFIRDTFVVMVALVVGGTIGLAYSRIPFIGIGLSALTGWLYWYGASLRETGQDVGDAQVFLWAAIIGGVVVFFFDKWVNTS